MVEKSCRKRRRHVGRAREIVALGGAGKLCEAGLGGGGRAESDVSTWVALRGLSFIPGATRNQ